MATDSYDGFGIEDLNQGSASIGEKELKGQETHLAGFDVVSPVFNYRNNRKIATTNPVKCMGANKCTYPAVFSTHSDSGDTSHFCSRHWEKKKAIDPELGRNYSTIDYSEPENIADINSSVAEERQEGRVRDADTIMKVTGIYTPVRGPGRPHTGQADSLEYESELDKRGTALLKALDQSAVSGGRNITPEHQTKLSLAHTALLHALSVTQNHTDVHALGDAYHAKAHELGMTNIQDRNAYFAHAMALQAQKTKKPVTPKSSNIILAGRETPSDSPITEDVMNELMGLSIPSQRDSGKKGIAERPE